MRIYLVGFMAAGKSTVGRVLAKKLGWQFVDLDREIERRSGHKIETLFARFGEPDFRRREIEAMEALKFWPRVVFATGGGTFVGEANVARIRRAGVVVFLDAPVELLFERLERSPRVRPLFADPARARRLYEERRPWYEKAHLRVPVLREDAASSVANRIVELLKESPCAI